MDGPLHQVPQPTKNAADVYEIAAAIVSTLLPPLAVFKAGTDVLIRKRMEDGQRLLLAEIGQMGTGKLAEEKWDYYVPAAYRFFEQVRLGEYEHNLRVLAKLIAGDLNAQQNDVDVGKIGRAARKLEMLPKAHLVALSRCKRAFEIYAASDESEGCWICIDESELRMSLAEVGVNAEAIECQEWLHELAARGILTSGGRPSRVSGTFYFKNAVFDEIISSAGAVATG
jgi:hypothetical protein